MANKLTLTKSISIHASKSKVWDALTKPELIKKYFFGTETITDWKVGSPILYRGEWEGKTYEDKGTVLAIEKEKLIKYSYWSSFSDKPDAPENYSNVTYTLKEGNGETIFTVVQEGIDDEEKLKHSEENWGVVMQGMKKMLEEK